MSKSETNPKSEVRTGEWAARSDKPGRSVFGNYRPADEDAAARAPPSGGSASEPPKGGTLTSGTAAAPSSAIGDLQSAIDTAVARSFLYRYLAQAYQDPTAEGWSWLCDGGTQNNLRAAWIAVGGTGDPPVPLGDPPSGMGSVSLSNKTTNPLSRVLVIPSGESPDGPGGSPVLPNFTPASFDSFLSAYVAAFGHAARGRCPLNEIEYGDLKADPLFQPHRLADLAAFYCAFGLEVAEDADERHDHLCLELEFMTVLAAKEAYALEHQLDAEDLAVCRDAQKKFLREHLGRWTPAFTRRLAAATDHPTLNALANFTRTFIETECARFGIAPGSEDLLLRPVNEAEESVCASCGVSQLPPGALAVAPV